MVEERVEGSPQVNNFEQVGGPVWEFQHVVSVVDPIFLRRALTRKEAPTYYMAGIIFPENFMEMK